MFPYDEHTNGTLLSITQPDFIVGLAKKMDDVTGPKNLGDTLRVAATQSISPQALLHYTLVGFQQKYAPPEFHAPGPVHAAMGIVHNTIDKKFPGDLYINGFGNFHRNMHTLVTPVFGNLDQTSVKALDYFLAAETAPGDYPNKLKAAKENFLKRHETIPPYHRFFNLVENVYGAAKHTALMAHYAAGDEERRQSRNGPDSWAFRAI